MKLNKVFKQICKNELYLGSSARKAYKKIRAMNIKGSDKVSYTNVNTYFKQEKGKWKKRIVPYRSNVLKERTGEVLAHVISLYNTNPKLSEQQIESYLLRNNGIRVKRSVIRKIKATAALRDWRPIKVPDISLEQKRKRFNITSDWIHRGESFANYIFSDESTFQLGGNVDYITTTDKHDLRRLIGTVKFPQKFQVWGAISRHGPGPLVFLYKNETLKADNYSAILEEYLLPYIDQTMGRRKAIFQQDNARAHTAKFTTNKLSGWGVQLAPWAPASPDLSPIEYIWREMKIWIRNEAKPTTMDELEIAIKDFWRGELTQTMINKYFDHTFKNVRMVYDALGGAIVDKWNHDKK